MEDAKQEAINNILYTFSESKSLSIDGLEAVRNELVGEVSIDEYLWSIHYIYGGAKMVVLRDKFKARKIDAGIIEELEELVAECAPVILQTNFIWDSVPSLVVGSREEGFTVHYSRGNIEKLNMEEFTAVKYAGPEVDKQSLERVATAIY